MNGSKLILGTGLQIHRSTPAQAPPKPPRQATPAMLNTFGNLGVFWVSVDQGPEYSSSRIRWGQNEKSMRITGTTTKTNEKSLKRQ